MADPILRTRTVNVVHPDSPREEIVARLQDLCELIQSELPRRVQGNDIFLPWQTTAPLLLARIASQGYTLALLIEHRHELDAQMVMRSLLEHLTLFAWLAIEPDDTSRSWQARNPEFNTLWWMQAQYRREKKLSEDQDQALGGILDDRLRSALRAMKARTRALEWPGGFPDVPVMAEEVDAHWAPRLAGWVVAEPKTTNFLLTFRGHYWALYTAGNASAHPDYGAIRRFLRAPNPGGYQRHYLVTEEQTDERVNVLVSISAFLIGDALAVADAALSWNSYDQALRVLDRWDEVRAPDLLLQGVATALCGADGRLFAQTPTRQVMAERAGERTAVTVAEKSGAWYRLAHVGNRRWELTTDRGETATWSADPPPGATARDLPVIGFDLGETVASCVEALAEVDWSTATSHEPDAWPETMPG